ncbi:DUF1990 family protein [Micromonospora sp. NBC_01813]|uniref:DUF1990 family protein n=1 Tax=Micromonospora sp. NBC_01813 TaxID=2975988 RepID=UPI002DD83C2A|nr:DUF1990 domain-containing protein [Micromonospora sp. NBC_01813]WSA11454.1 DUF1990 domain-containing protein [Micromonospora sp. NBC_01813]
MLDVTYPQAGATGELLRRVTGTVAPPPVLPDGYRHLRYRTRLRPGSFPMAARAVLTWRMHRAAGARVTATAPQAAPGVRVSVALGVGPLRLVAPCVVVWAVDDADRAGFAYGTLPGHPASGEEAFLVERRGEHTWLSVVAFSRPVAPIMRLAGPLAALAQRGYAWRLGVALRRLSEAGERA